MASLDHFKAVGPDSFQPLPGYALEVRDLGITELSGGAIGAKIFRARTAGEGEEMAHAIPWHMHDWGFQMGYVIKGWAEYEFEGIGKIRFEEGMSIWQLPKNRHREFAASADFEAIEVTWPAHTTTTAFIYDEETAEYREMKFDD
ncbi:hypothetical protein [Rhodococcus sp. NPDC060176]|uniref:hypothetical protein n=1 Tax=Rhodococcus sp. NPDC060176 TaxID=3347062 RepID=UPI0036591320